MKLITLIALLFFSVVVYAKDWNPFPVNQTSYFSFEKDGQTYIEKYSINAVEIEGQEYYFFKSKDEYLNCECENSEVYFSDIYFDPDFSVDYYTYNDGRYNLYYFESLDSGFELKESSEWGAAIKVDCRIDEGWSNWNANVTCTEIKVDNVLGVEDSVKVFTVGEMGGTFVLSKTFGLVSMPKSLFYGNDKSNAQAQSLTLLGLETEDYKLGFHFPEFEDYLPYQVGDAFYFNYLPREMEFVYNDGKPVTLIDEITNVTRTTDSIVVSMSRKIYDNYAKVDKSYDFEKVYSKESLGKVLNGYPMGHEFVHLEMRGEELVGFDSLRIDIIAGDTIFYASLKSSGLWKRNVEDCMFGHAVDYYYQEVFSTKYGLVKDICKTLVGGVKNGETFGNTSIINYTSVDEYETDVFNVYPNPAKDVLYLDSNMEGVSKIRIEDVSGRLMFQTDYSETVDVGELLAGTYFVKVVKDNGDVVVSKFLKK